MGRNHIISLLASNYDYDLSLPGIGRLSYPVIKSVIFLFSRAQSPRNASILVKLTHCHILTGHLGPGPQGSSTGRSQFLCSPWPLYLPSSSQSCRKGEESLTGFRQAPWDGGQRLYLRIKSPSPFFQKRVRELGEEFSNPQRRFNHFLSRSDLQIRKGCFL